MQIQLGGGEPVFPTSKTFLYHYDGLLLTGMPDAGLARSGVKLKCKLEISSTGPRLHLLKISDLEIQQFNGIWPKDSFISSPKLTQALKRQLGRPIKFEYVAGQVGDIFIPEGVSDTVVNIYRGMLTVLQLTMKKTQNVYSLQERGIGGTCHTSYTIDKDAKGNTLSVTKSKDLNDCKDRARMVSGNAYFHPCATCRQRNKNSRATATYNYKLRVMGVGYLLQEAAVHEVHQFTPFNEIDGAAVLEARQRLVLAAVEDRAYSSPVDNNDYSEKVSLRYHFPSELIAAPVQFLQTQNTETRIIELLNHLVKHFEGFAAKESPEKFVELVYRLRAASYGEIEALWKQFSSKQDYRRWILDAIPAIANPLTLRFLKHKIDEKDLTEFEATQAALLALHLIKANHEALTEAKSLLAVIKSQKMPLLRKVSFLAYGSLVQKICSPRDQPCPEGALQPMYDLLEEAASAAHEEDMILALKALGNSGEPQSMKRIQKFLPGFSSSASQLPVMIQSVAVSALRNIALKDPEKVRDICLQLFANPDGQPLIRMVAGAVLLDSKPPPEVVMTLTNILLREVNSQVAGFIFPLLESMSRDSSPDLQDVSAAFKMAVTILRGKYGNVGSSYSKHFHYDIFKDSLMAGISSTVNFLYNDVEFIPSCAMSRVKAHFMGTFIDLIETCFHAEGLQELLTNKHLFSPDGGEQNVKKILDMLKKLSEWKPLPSKQPLASAYIKMFGQEIFFHQLDKESLHDLFKVGFSFQRGHSSLKTAVNHLQNGVHIRWSKPLLSSENRHVVPTCVGLPLETSLRYSSVTRAEIQAQTHITPVPSQDVNIVQLLDSNVRLQLSSSVSLAKNIIFTMGVNTDLIQSGLEIHGKVNIFFPANIAAEFDVNQKKFKLDIIPSAQENEVVSLRSKAFSVTRNAEDTAALTMIPVLPPGTKPNVARQVFNLRAESAGDSAVTEAKFSGEVLSEANGRFTEQPIPNPHALAFSTCHAATELGFQMCLEKKSASAGFIRDCPLYSVVGDHSVNVIFKPVRADASVEKIQVEFQVGSKAATKIVRTVNLQQSCEDEQETDVASTAFSKLRKILGRDGNRVIMQDSVISNTNSSSSSESSRNDTSDNVSEDSRESKSSKNQEKHHHRNKERAHQKHRHGEEEERKSGKRKKHQPRHQQKKKKVKKQHACRHQKDEKNIMQKCHECWDETKNIEHKLKDIQRKHEEIQHEKENIQHEKQKVHDERENIQHEKQKVHDERENIQHEKQKVHDERENIQHEKEQIQHQQKKLKHKKEEMEHEAEEIEHEKKKMEHAGTKMEHEKEKMEHEKEKMEHAKVKMEHKKEEMEHEAEEIDHEKKKMEHARTKMEHEKEKMEHAKVKMEHEKEKMEHEKDKMEQEKDNMQHERENAHRDHNKQTEKKDNQRDRPQENPHKSEEHGRHHHQHHPHHPCKFRSSDESGHESQKTSLEKGGKNRGGHTGRSGDSSSGSQSGHVASSRMSHRRHVDKNKKPKHLQKNATSTECTGTSSHPHGTCNKSHQGKKSRTPHKDGKSSRHRVIDAEFTNVTMEALGLDIQEARFTSASDLLGREKNNEQKTVNSWLESDRGSSSSSSSSGESEPYTPVLLGVLPEFVLLVRAFMSDNSQRGYQTTGYMDPVRHRAQLTTVTLEEKSFWKACVRAAASENHKAQAVVTWGHECQDYRVSAKFSKGQLAGHPAVQLNWRWARLPSWLRKTTQGVMRFVPGMAYMLGFSQIHSKNPSRQLLLRVAATSPETIDTIIKTPELTFYRQAIPVPLDLTQAASPASGRNRGLWSNIPEMAAMVTREEEAECLANGERIVTFDKLDLTCPLAPTNCPTVLAQDCTNRLKFLISVQKMAPGSSAFGMNIMLGSSDVKVFSDVSENFHVLLNGAMLLLQNDTYINEKECVRIHKNSTTVTVKAPKHGIEQISFDGETSKIMIASWMRGSTCGVCGNADGLQDNDLRKPNGEAARSCSGLVRSWTLADNSCRGICALNRQFVMLKNQLIDGEQFTCYSVEPVLRCVDGCHATQTVPVKTAFSCLPGESAIRLEDWPLNHKDRLEDLIKEVDVHTDCVCAPECA
ncbi:vitellogenin-1-like [Spea bombifrons]|uniref:vitellogenin-1-like n=1 Tax=Spea bombifrons TaxID=233779 RepID=UPI00234ABD99|nr:vitellogenin-1-like [Spea bombifrons]